MTSVKSHNLSLNFADVNHTEGIDVFCTKQLAGPIFWGVCTLPCSLVGVTTSAWVLWANMQRQRWNFLSNDIYMLNLIFMNLLYNVLVFPYLLNFFFYQNEVYFKIADILFCFNMNGQPLLVGCIALECYMAVVFPVPFMTLKLSKHRLVVCLSVWALSLLIGILFFFNNHLYTSPVTAIPYFFSLPIIAFCSLSIRHALTKPDPSGRSGVHPQKQRALQAINNGLIWATVSYLPPLAVYGVSPLIPLSQQDIFCHVSIPTVVVPVLGGTIMPVLLLQDLGIFNLKRCACVRGSDKN